MTARRQRLLHRAVLVAGSTVLAAGLCEIGLRLIRDEQLFLPYHRNSVQLFYPSEAITPGVSGVSRFSTNRFGCRGPEPNGERYKLLTIGGSTTADVVLDDSECWSQLVMDLVNRRSGDPRRLWVTNSGLDGKNSRHHVMHARYLLPSLPKLDFVLVYAGLNDAGAWLYSERFDSHEMDDPAAVENLIGESFRVCRYTADFEPWYKHLELWKRASMLKDSLRTDLTLRSAGQGIPEDAELKWIEAAREVRARVRKESIPVAKRETLPLALEFYAKNLATIARLVRQAGAEPIFMSQAIQLLGLSDEERSSFWLGAMDSGASYATEEEMCAIVDAFNATMAETAQAEGARFIDLGRLLRGHTEYYYDLCHFNEAGARAAAECVADALMGWLDERSAPDAAGRLLPVQPATPDPGR